MKNRSQFHVVQVQVIFQLPKLALSSIFLSSHLAPPTNLAYVKWFSLLSTPHESHGMYQVSRSYHNGCRLASIIPLTEVCWSVQLFPIFGPVMPQNWQSPTVLDECQSFHINPFLDRHMYRNLNYIGENLSSAE